jgi:hypothetical protein
VWITLIEIAVFIYSIIIYGVTDESFLSLPEEALKFGEKVNSQFIIGYFCRILTSLDTQMNSGGGSPRYCSITTSLT